MTNISEKETQKDMQSHIQEAAYKLIDEFLPEFYTTVAKERLQNDGLTVDPELIQAVRNKRGKKNPLFSKIIHVLVEIAHENKLILEDIKSKIDNH